MLRLSVFLLSASVLLSACGPRAAPSATVSPSQPTAGSATVEPTTAPTSKPTAVPPTIPPTNTAQPTTSAAPTAAPDKTTLALQPLVDGLRRPDYLTHAGDARLFVIEQPGRIRVIENGQLLDRPFLDLTDRVLSSGNEQGLLSVAFHPDYAANGQFFVDYTRKPDGATVVSRFTVTANDRNQANASSEQIILQIEQPEPNHNGGLVLFGPDGYLYVGTGDGGGAGDRHGQIGNGQNKEVLLGKLLRLDVTDQATYAIPSSNPFGTEIWAWGLRNPWRFSFDRETKDLYIADVGQNQYEEVNFQRAASNGGENYGWRTMEGAHCYNPQTGCDQTGLVLPVAEYSHDVGGCSVTGGYVYRGAQYPGLQGRYFFGDYCTGIIWSLQRDANQQWQMQKALDTDAHISSFGEDVSGELYVVDHGGAVYQLIAK